MARRLLEIRDGAGRLAAAFEVDGQLRREFVGARAEGAFETSADALVQLSPLRRRQALVEDAPIQLMDEDVRAGDGAVGPFRRTGGADELPIARERAAACVDGEELGVERRGDEGRRKARAGDARGVEQLAI